MSPENVIYTLAVPNTAICQVANTLGTASGWVVNPFMSLPISVFPGNPDPELLEHHCQSGSRMPVCYNGGTCDPENESVCQCIFGWTGNDCRTRE